MYIYRILYAAPTQERINRNLEKTDLYIIKKMYHIFSMPESTVDLNYEGNKIYLKERQVLKFQRIEE